MRCGPPGTYLGPLFAGSDPLESRKVTPLHRRSPVTTLGLFTRATAKGIIANPLDGSALTLE
jgi:hypothetical protein